MLQVLILMILLETHFTVYVMVTEKIRLNVTYKNTRNPVNLKYMLRCNVKSNSNNIMCNNVSKNLHVLNTNDSLIIIKLLLKSTCQICHQIKIQL